MWQRVAEKISFTIETLLSMLMDSTFFIGWKAINKLEHLVTGFIHFKGDLINELVSVILQIGFAIATVAVPFIFLFFDVKNLYRRLRGEEQ